MAKSGGSMESWQKRMVVVGAEKERKNKERVVITFPKVVKS